MRSVVSYQGIACPLRRANAAPTANIRRLSRVGISASREHLVLQVSLCTLPAGALLALGLVTEAGLCLWVLLGLSLLRLLLLGKSEQMLCLILAVSPLINLLRQSAFYNVVVPLLAVALLSTWLTTPQSLRGTLRRFPMAIALLAYLTLYYLISYAVTRDYSVNLRMFELALVVLIVLIIGRRADLLGSSLRGLAVCAIGAGAAMLPNLRSAEDARLGEVVIDGQQLGNPILLGLPLALSFLALSVERGRWAGLQDNRAYRFGLLSCTAVLLALTTSRVSWLVVVCGVAVTLALGARQRATILLVIAVAALSIQFVMLSSFDDSFQKGVERTLGGERTLANRTSGRSEQWVVAYHAFSDSTASILYGYGPGTGADVYAKESLRVPGVEFMVGRRMALHSLIMQVGVETGLLGLVPLVAWMVQAALRIRRWTGKNKLCFPLVCFCSYAIVIATVSGNDVTSGFFLGIGLLASSKLLKGVQPRYRSAGPTRRLIASSGKPQRQGIDLSD